MQIVALSIVLLLGASITAMQAQTPRHRASSALTPLLTETLTIRERADQLLQQGKPGEALPLYETWLRAAPTDAEAAFNAARAYVQAGRQPEAMVALDLALRQGLQRTARIEADSLLVPLLRASSTLAAELRSRRKSDSASTVLYTRQTRIGTSLVTYPAKFSADRLYRLIVLLHGNGHSSSVITSWAKRLGLDDVIFVAPQAPYVKVYETVASARGRFSAAGEELYAPDSLLDDVVTTSAEWYHTAMMDAWNTLPVDKTRKPVIVGFSQGGFYAHVLATRYPGDIQAICSISASMYAHGYVTAKYPLLRTYGVRALVTHGTKDVVVPLQTAELIRAAMAQAGVEHEYYTFDGGHWPTVDADQRIVEWLRSR